MSYPNGLLVHCRDAVRRGSLPRRWIETGSPAAQRYGYMGLRTFLSVIGSRAWSHSSLRARPEAGPDFVPGGGTESGTGIVIVSPKHVSWGYSSEHGARGRRYAETGC